MVQSCTLFESRFMNCLKQGIHKLLVRSTSGSWATTNTETPPQIHTCLRWVHRSTQQPQPIQPWCQHSANRISSVTEVPTYMKAPLHQWSAWHPRTTSHSTSLFFFPLVPFTFIFMYHPFYVFCCTYYKIITPYTEHSVYSEPHRRP